MDESAAQGHQAHWVRNYTLIIITALCAGMAFFCINNGIAMTVSEKSGDTTMPGIISFGYSLGAVFGSIMGGFLCDRWSKRRVLLTFGISYAVLVLLIAGFNPLWFLAPVRILQGIAYTAFNVALPSAVADLMPENQLGKGMSRMSVVFALGEAIGPSMAIGLYSIKGPVSLFSVCFIIFILFTIPSSFYRDRAPQSAGSRSVGNPLKLKGGNPLWRILEKNALPVALAFGLFNISVGLIWNYMALYLTRSGIGDSRMFFILQATAMILARTLVGSLIDKHRPAQVYIPVVLVGISAYALMSTENAVLFTIAGLCYGISVGVMPPFINTLCVRYAPQGRSGTANATMLVCGNLGLGIGGMFWGRVIDLSGGTFFFAFMGAILCVLLAGVVGFAIMKKREHAVVV